MMKINNVQVGNRIQKITVSREKMSLDRSLYKKKETKRSATSPTRMILNKNFIYQLITNNMYTIVIKKTQNTRLFDRMPMPRARVRHITLARKALTKRVVAAPFARTISRIQ
jgi:hypothetical protein